MCLIYKKSYTQCEHTLQVVKCCINLISQGVCDAHDDHRHSRPEHHVEDEEPLMRDTHKAFEEPHSNESLESKDYGIEAYGIEDGDEGETENEENYEDQMDEYKDEDEDEDEDNDGGEDDDDGSDEDSEGEGFVFINPDDSDHGTAIADVAEIWLGKCSKCRMGLKRNLGRR